MSFKAPGNTPPGREPDINLGLRLPHRTARRLLPANSSARPQAQRAGGGEIKGPRAPLQGGNQESDYRKTQEERGVVRTGKTFVLFRCSGRTLQALRVPLPREPDPLCEGLGRRRGWGSIIQPSGASGVGALRAPHTHTPSEAGPLGVLASSETPGVHDDQADSSMKKG